MLRDFQSLSIDDYKLEVSKFLDNAKRTANDALFSYGHQENIKGWPSTVEELTEMIFDKAGINRASFNLSVPGDLSDFENNDSSNTPTQFFAAAAATPTGGFTFSIPGISNLFPGTTPTPTPSTGTDIHIPGLDPNQIRKLCSTSSLGGLSSCIGDAIANVIDGFNNPLFNLTPISNFIRYIGNSFGQFLSGTLDIDKIVTGFVSAASSIISGDNPIGYVIRGIATTIFNNPAAPIAGFVNVADFVSKASKSIISFFESVVGQLSDGAKSIISQIVNGIVNGVLDVAHNSNSNSTMTKPIQALDFPVLADEFFKFTDMQTSRASLDAQKLMRITQYIGNMAYSADPTFYNIFINPTKENIRKTVVLVAKIVADYKSS